MQSFNQNAIEHHRVQLRVQIRARMALAAAL